MTARARIRLSIDRLALYGVEPADAAVMRAALDRQLRSLLGNLDPSAVRGAGDRAQLRLDVGPAGSPEALASAAAGAIAGALGGPSARGRR